MHGPRRAARGRPRPDDVPPGGGPRAGAGPAVRARRPRPRRGRPLGRGRPEAAGRRARGVLPGGDGPAVGRAAPHGRVPGPAAGRGDAAVQRHVRRPSSRHARWLGGRGDLRVGHERGGPGARRAGRPVRGAGRDRRRSRRGIRARDVGPRRGRPGGRRPRPGDQPLDARARPLRPQDAGRRDRGALPRPDRGPASGGAGAGRRPGRPRRGRGGAGPGRRHRRRARGVRDGLDPAPQPRGGARPGHARGGARPWRGRPARAARDRARSGHRAGRRGQRAPRARRCSVPRCSGSTAWRPATTPRPTGCEQRSAPGTTSSGRLPPRLQTRSLSIRRTPSICTAVDSSAPAAPIVASSASVSGSATET